MPDYSIGQVAEGASLPASTLRYYEKMGLLPRAVRRSGRRSYSEDVFSHLSVIRLCKLLGFELSDIKTVMDGLTKGDRSTAKLKRLAEHKLPEIEDSIARAQLMRDLLRKAVLCRCPTLETCAERARGVRL